jgi:ABC-type Fe3+/spermidine/putrescine transport system ATPase subunit
MSDRVAIMSHGRVEQIGAPHELYAAPKNLFVARFLGESNLLPVTVLGMESGPTSFAVDGVDGIWSLPAHDGAPPAGPAFLLARPESVIVAGTGQPSVRATIAEIVYLGELTATRLVVDTGQEIWMRAMGPSPADVSETLSIGWNAAHARVLHAEDDSASDAT